MIVITLKQTQVPSIFISLHSRSLPLLSEWESVKEAVVPYRHYIFDK